MDARTRSAYLGCCYRSFLALSLSSPSFLHHHLGGVVGHRTAVDKRDHRVALELRPVVFDLKTRQAINTHIESAQTHELKLIESHSYRFRDQTDEKWRHEEDIIINAFLSRKREEETFTPRRAHAGTQERLTGKNSTKYLTNYCCGAQNKEHDSEVT